MTADLFTAAAERSALASGRAYSQELAEIRRGANAPALPRALFETCEHGAEIDTECLLCEPILDGFAGRPGTIFTADGSTEQECRVCGESFIAAPRADSTCNLCRRPQC